MRPRIWRSIAGASLISMLPAACDAPRPTAPVRAAPQGRGGSSISDAELVRELAMARGVVPLPPAPYLRPHSHGSARRSPSIRSERHARHRLHDLSSPRVRHRRWEELVGRTRGNRSRVRSLASRRRVHPAQCAAAVQHERDAAPLLGRSCRGGRTRHPPHAGRRSSTTPNQTRSCATTTPRSSSLGCKAPSSPTRRRFSPNETRSSMAWCSPSRSPRG